MNWLNAEVNTEPCDRSRIEVLIKRMYSSNSAYADGALPEPKIIWCGSPVGLEVVKTVHTRCNPKTTWPINYGPHALLDQATATGRVSSPPRLGNTAIYNALLSAQLHTSREWPPRSTTGPLAEWHDIDALMNPEWLALYKAAVLLFWPAFNSSLASVMTQRDASGREHNSELNKSMAQDAYYATHDAGARESVAALIELAYAAELVVPYNTVCFVSERKTAVHLKRVEAETPLGRLDRSHVDDLLHKDGGPALAYPDGVRFWYLNGVRVSRALAETPGEKLDPRLILTEQNADIRREIVRKVGPERLCLGLNAKCVDKWEDYRLLLLDIGDGRLRPYLEMRNKSVGCLHIEGVHPDCDTVKKALAWRNGTSEYIAPVVLT